MDTTTFQHLISNKKYSPKKLAINSHVINGDSDNSIGGYWNAIMQAKQRKTETNSCNAVQLSHKLNLYQVNEDEHADGRQRNKSAGEIVGSENANLKRQKQKRKNAKNQANPKD